MKVLIVHNEYQQAGGEDKVFEAEGALLERHGHVVSRLIVRNDVIRGFGAKLRTALSTCCSEFGKRLARRAIDEHRPDVVHVHNFFPLLSPAVFHACREAGVPVVHTLHNYRLICPSALLMIDGEIYEESIERSAYRSVRKRAYRNSYLGTLVVARMIEYHKKHGTWRNSVDRFIALTDFARSKFVQAGLPASRIALKPNFIADPSPPESYRKRDRRGALFVGRLSAEKGVRTLVRAWRDIDYPLVVAGDGPLGELSATAPDNVKFVGNRDSREIADLMSRSAFLVMPSEWYEGFPIVLLEAYAHRLPVIASRLGGLAELVVDGETGLHFEAKNAMDLRDRVEWMIDHPADGEKLAENARAVYEEKYTPEKNHDELVRIYDEAMRTSTIRSAVRPSHRSGTRP